MIFFNQLHNYVTSFYSQMYTKTNDVYILSKMIIF